MPDSPPTSRMSAPAASSSRASATRASRSGYAPASEKESGEALTIPISHGRAPSASVRPAAATSWERTGGHRRARQPMRTVRSDVRTLPARSVAVICSEKLPPRG